MQYNNRNDPCHQEKVSVDLDTHLEESKQFPLTCFKSPFKNIDSLVLTSASLVAVTMISCHLEMSKYSTILPSQYTRPPKLKQMKDVRHV